MTNKGLMVVIDGSRINLRVFRRFFYPIKIKHLEREFIVYSDTRREAEINYNRAEDYDLDNPFNRIKLIRLARATKSISVSPEDDNEYCITICTNRELFDPDAKKLAYLPFDPSRLEPLEDRIKNGKRKIEWEKRFTR